MKTIVVYVLLVTIFHLNVNGQEDTVKNQLPMEETHKDTTSKKESVEITTSGPILIKNYEPNESPFWEWVKRIGGIVGFLAGILGLIATWYIVSDRWFKEPEINSKIISFNCDSGKFEQNLIGQEKALVAGLRYFIKLSINVTSKNMNYTDVRIEVKFKNDNTIYFGEVFSPRNYSEWGLDGIPHTLKLPQKDLLYYKSSLSQDMTHLEYITFIVFGVKNEFQGNDQIPETIQLCFVSSDKSFFKITNNIYCSNIMRLDADAKKYIWEDEIWTKK